MTFWIYLWKTVLVVGVTLFAGMACWVAVGGYRDIQRLLKSLEEDPPSGDESDA